MTSGAGTPPPQFTAHALPVGTRLGEFELRRVIGIGGFGIVYLAFDHGLEREVAIKEYMPSSMAMRTETHQVSITSPNHAETFALGLRSFVNEARLLARFDHPSLLKVHRFWEAQGTAYMVMPLLRGRTLRETRQQMLAPPGEPWLRSLLESLLGALEVLHREDVFHRDIAPDNIFIGEDGVPMLLDFGAARRVIGDRSQTLTAILKPSYAPIEQYGESAALRQGAWTDLYALGATLHFLVTQAPPLPATARLVQDDHPLAKVATGTPVPQAFLEVIDWMLAPKPTDRPQSVAELREVLRGRRRVPVRIDGPTGTIWQRAEPPAAQGGGSDQPDEPDVDVDLTVAVPMPASILQTPVARPAATGAPPSVPPSAPAPPPVTGGAISGQLSTLGSGAASAAPAGAPADLSSTPLTMSKVASPMTGSGSSRVAMPGNSDSQPVHAGTQPPVGTPVGTPAEATPAVSMPEPGPSAHAAAEGRAAGGAPGGKGLWPWLGAGMALAVAGGVAWWALHRSPSAVPGGDAAGALAASAAASAMASPETPSQGTVPPLVAPGPNATLPESPAVGPAGTPSPVATPATAAGLVPMPAQAPATSARLPRAASGTTANDVRARPVPPPLAPVGKPAVAPSKPVPGDRRPTTPGVAEPIAVPAAVAPPDPASQARPATPRDVGARPGVGRPEPAVPEPVAQRNPREQCGGRVLLALHLCLQRECVKPQYRDHDECVRVRQIDERAGRANSP